LKINRHHHRRRRHHYHHHHHHHHHLYGFEPTGLFQTRISDLINLIIFDLALSIRLIILILALSCYIFRLIACQKSPA
jgi:hypothetical protein